MNSVYVHSLQQKAVLRSGTIHTGKNCTQLLPCLLMCLAHRSLQTKVHQPLHIPVRCQGVSETELSVKTRWSRPEVLQLLSVFSAKRQRFKDINVKNKTVWEEISTALNKNGVSCTAKMCETKIKNLKRSYVSCVDHKKTSGSGKMRKCVYDELQDIYSKDDATEPQALCSNVDGVVI